MRPVATDVGRSAVRVLDTRVKLLIKYHQHIIKRPFRYVFSKQICDMHVIINSAMCHSLITNMSVLLIVVWKCTLAASHAAPSPVSMSTRETDGQRTRLRVYVFRQKL